MAVLEGEMVDLVITDLYMPKMDGVEFLQRLGQKRPGLKIIAMSGGGFADKVGLLEAAQRLGARHTVSKPFERAELLEAVDAALQG
jgi:CheY-like chemotaxis protein